VAGSGYRNKFSNSGGVGNSPIQFGGTYSCTVGGEVLAFGRSKVSSVISRKYYFGKRVKRKGGGIGGKKSRAYEL